MIQWLKDWKNRQFETEGAWLPKVAFVLSVFRSGF